MLKIMNMAGIYRLVLKRPEMADLIYIGQASILRKRRDVHFRTLRLGTHKNSKLQRAFVKYGAAALRFEVVLVCERRKDLLDLYEQALLDQHIGQPLLNINRLAVGSRLGRPMSAETKAKIGAGNKGKVRSQESRDAVRASNQIRVVSDETRSKMSSAHTGKKFPGRVLSATHRANVGASQSGKKRPPQVLAKAWATRKAKLHADDQGRGAV